jgi:demethylspheroidene O-methyltransferase
MAASHLAFLPSWFDALRAWRDRKIADPRFRRWAARFPVTRPIARRRAHELFDLVAGFTYTQVLLACVRLDLFEALAAAPLCLDTLMLRTDLQRDAARRLLDAAVALRLLTHERDVGDGPRYGLGPLGVPMVGNTALAALIEHHAVLYVDLADPVALFRSPRGQTALAHYWPYAGGPSASALEGHEVDRYSALMAASQPLVAHEILDAYSLAPHRCLLDVGGGEGAFAKTAVRRWPQLRAVVFDLPAVAMRANQRIGASGLASRIRAVGGSFLTDELPRGADVISLVRVVHDHDDEAALALLRAARKALPDDGVLLLAEPMADTPGAQAMGDAYFGVYLWAMGSGRPRTARRLGELLASAGFAAPVELRSHLPLQTRVLLARPVRVANREVPSQV